MAGMTLSHLDKIIGMRPEAAGVPGIFVETGTLECKTTLIAAERFADVHTIDLSPEIVQAARLRCEGTAIKCHLGDSADVLPLLSAVYHDRPLVAYLDAHHFWRGAGDLASVIADENPMPLWTEIAALALRSQADWIIVDDVHAFGRPPEGNEADWTGIGIAPILDALGRSRIIDAEVIGDQLVIWRSAV